VLDESSILDANNVKGGYGDLFTCWRDAPICVPRMVARNATRSPSAKQTHKGQAMHVKWPLTDEAKRPRADGAYFAPPASGPLERGVRALGSCVAQHPNLPIGRSAET
jgi:hypothetical protein